MQNDKMMKLNEVIAVKMIFFFFFKSPFSRTKI